jgi:nucleoside-diphosphate-sugar epimerase
MEFKDSSKILVTGASGFIGSAVCSKLSNLGRPFCGTIRDKSFIANVSKSIDYLIVDNINTYKKWPEVFNNINSIIYCAGRAYVTNEAKVDNLDINVALDLEGIKFFAEAAAAAGVRRIVFLSTLKVHGESTIKFRKFHFNDQPAPIDYYSFLKYDSEQILRKVSAETGIEVVVVRPPLVYGPKVKGNFLKLLNLIAKGLPIPIGGKTNKRSLIYIDNLVDLLIRCAEHPGAAGKTFLISDDQDLSTKELITKIAFAMKKSPRFFSLPICLLQLVGRIIGKSSVIEKLTNSLQVDISNTCEVLDWRPPVSIDEGIQQTVNEFMSKRL